MPASERALIAHGTLGFDGTVSSVRAAIQDVKNDPGQVALLGAVGESLALASLDEAARANSRLLMSRRGSQISGTTRIVTWLRFSHHARSRCVKC